MKILASYSIKGGVGKTASCVNLAHIASMKGARTLVWDLDPQGASSFYFRIKPKVKGGGRKLVHGKRAAEPLLKGTDYPRLDLLPADFSYRHMDLDLGDTKNPVKRMRKVLEPLRSEYDLVFLDCAPSISLVSESLFGFVDALLVPLIPTTLSVRTLDQLVRQLKRSDRSDLVVLPFFCMVDRRKKLHRQICADGQLHAAPCLKTNIPYSTWVEQMGLHRAPLATFAYRSAPNQAYRQLWAEILEALESQEPEAEE